MRIALIGAAGQLGTDLARAISGVVPLTHDDIEITDACRVAEVLDTAEPDVVINVAAYNLVDRAEEEPDLAFAVNAEGPRILARWCEQQEVTLVHVSTDYVFGREERRTTPYLETDLPGPLGVYGESKLTGEIFVRSECTRHFVIRTCGLYGQAATRSKGNFAQTMLRLARERPQLRVVNDQYCTPSYTVDVALGIAALIQTEKYGLYHLTNGGATNWCDFAAATLRFGGVDTPVVPISSSEYPTQARRPGYSVLNCDKFTAVTGLRLPSWDDALQRYLASVQQQQTADQSGKQT